MDGHGEQVAETLSLKERRERAVEAARRGAGIVETEAPSKGLYVSTQGAALYAGLTRAAWQLASTALSHRFHVALTKTMMLPANFACQ
eukprot:301522-Chlamydomonas_euryale.AAC.6